MLGPLVNVEAVKKCNAQTCGWVVQLHLIHVSNCFKTSVHISVPEQIVTFCPS